MAIDLSKGFDEAQLLLNQVPMPRDIVEQLDRIRKTIPENELEMFCHSMGIKRKERISSQERK